MLHEIKKRLKSAAYRIGDAVIREAHFREASKGEAIKRDGEVYGVVYY